jgi:thiamine pyrophosphate-dependent acetolactate synthase large subunit-like protein
LLLVIHNNRAYHAEVMLVQRTAARRGRGNDKVDIGNVIRDPAPDYAKIAQGFGVYAEGPISDPDALGPAFERALARVRAGEPALVDVISQPR